MTNKNKGFTLVELIIVIAILAIIMLIAIPNFSGIRQRMQVRADKASAAQIGKAVRIWYTDKYATENQSVVPELKAADGSIKTEIDSDMLDVTPKMIEVDGEVVDTATGEIMQEDESNE